MGFITPVDFPAFSGIICRQSFYSPSSKLIYRGSYSFLNAAQLTISQRQDTKGAVIEAVGEVDLTTAPQLKEALMAAVNGPEKSPVIVDLSKVDFIDSAGLALLVEARKKLAPEGRTLNVLLTPSRQPERVLKLGRFDTIMHLAYSLNDV